MGGDEIFFEQIRSSGCLSYLLGCAQEKVCVAIDPELRPSVNEVQQRLRQLGGES